MGFFEFVEQGVKKVNKYVHDQKKKQDMQQKQAMQIMKQQTEYMRQKAAFLKAKDKLDAQREKRRKQPGSLGGGFLGRM